MPYERTQRRNPHKLTINQHVFPAASIARFAQKDGRVSVFLREQEKTLRLPPRDVLFCAKRVWNQTSENGFMRKVECTFQTLAERILNGTFSLGPTENQTISRFYSLCRLRAEARQTPPADIQINGVQPGRPLTKNEEEMLEKNGYVSARGTTMPSRHMAGLRIQILLSRLYPQETTWAAVYSRTIEFIVPDSFCEIGIVSLSPNCCLVANVEGGEISSDNAIEINRIAIDKSSTYYFAQDLAKCGACHRLD
jgi:hypothetical protein